MRRAQPNLKALQAITWAMVPMRMSSIFKSRWMALVWAAGIIWAAYDFAEAQPQTAATNNVASDTDSAAVTADDQNKVAQLLGG